MRTFRFRDEDESKGGVLFFAVGAIAGLAAGMLIAQRFGGLAELTDKVRERFSRDATHEAIEGEDWEASDDYDDEDELDENVEDESDFASADEELEERVLEAYRNDPVLAERAVDIGAIGEGIIELAGWVHDVDESEHAVTIARGVPGVETVVNRLALRDDEDRIDDSTRRVKDGDASLTGAGWEGQQVGVGRPRQGSSDEPNRHASPKAELEDRWMREQEALRHPADEMTAAERRQRAKKNVRADRAGGAPVAPGGVPKADHVQEPNAD